VHARRYSAGELARTFGLHPRTVRREVARGNLAALRSPSGYFMSIPEPALNAWLGENAKKVLARSLAWNRRRTTQPPSTTPDPAGGDPTEAIQGKPRQRKNKP
jgi:hypothetical protein